MIVVNFERTKDFYLRFGDICTCAICENFTLGVDETFPLLIQKLKDFGIDVHKPHEVEGFAMPKKNTVDYYLFQYIVIGEWDDTYISDLDGIKLRKSESHPSTGITKEHFVLDVIGDMIMPWKLEQDINEVYPELSQVNKTSFIKNIVKKHKRN